MKILKILKSIWHFKEASNYIEDSGATRFEVPQSEINIDKVDIDLKLSDSYQEKDFIKEKRTDQKLDFKRSTIIQLMMQQKSCIQGPWPAIHGI